MGTATTGSAPRLPNFFLAGVPKAGTTSLYFYLRQHPQIYMSPMKEPMYWGAGDMLAGPYHEQYLRYIKRDPGAYRAYLRDMTAPRPRFYALRWDHYVKLFENVTSETAIGEASVDYFFLPSAAQAIRAALPHARLIFVLRDPAEKVFASFHVARRRDPGLNFRSWFMAAAEPGCPSWPLVDGARYATHLERFLGLFPREQMRIYLYDAYRSNAPAMMRDIFGFLGVDPEHTVDLTRRHNVGIVPRWAALHRVRRRLVGAWRPTRLVPEPLRGMLRGLYYRQRDDSPMHPDDRRMVIDYYRDEVARTGELIGRDLSAWLR